MSDELKTLTTELSDVQGFREEHRIVCKSFGQPGHHEHAYQKDTEELAKRFAEKRTVELAGSKMAEFELPYRYQNRVVSDWSDDGLA